MAVRALAAALSLTGALMFCAALYFVDWRIGLAVAGLVLFAWATFLVDVDGGE